MMTHEQFELLAAYIEARISERAAGAAPLPHVSGAYEGMISAVIWAELKKSMKLQ